MASMLNVKNSTDGSIKIAAHPASSMFLSTDKLPQDSITEKTPVFIDLYLHRYLHVKYSFSDDGLYIYPTVSRTLCGGFLESDFKALNPPSHNFLSEWNIPLPDWDDFYPVLKRLLKRCPSLSNLKHVGVSHYTDWKIINFSTI